MPGLMTAGVNLQNIHMEDWHLPFLLAAGITAADVGKAVTMDTVANTVKLAGDDDEILGRLETVEIRTTEGINVGTVAQKGVLNLPYTGTAPTPTSQVVGSATPGVVKVAGTPAVGRRNIVVDRNTAKSAVTVILL
jgi:hypothetical protein